MSFLSWSPAVVAYQMKLLSASPDSHMVPVGAWTSALPGHLSAYVSSEPWEMAQVHGPLRLCEGLRSSSYLLVSGWLQTGPALSIVAIWGTNQWMEDLFIFSLNLILSLLYRYRYRYSHIYLREWEISAFQIAKLILKNWLFELI